MPDIPPDVVSNVGIKAIEWAAGAISVIGTGAFWHLKAENNNLKEENKRLAEDITDCKGALSQEIKEHNKLVLDRLDSISKEMVSNSKCKSNQDLFTEKIRSINEIQTVQHGTIEDKLDKLFEIQDGRNK